MDDGTKIWKVLVRFAKFDGSPDDGNILAVCDMVFIDGAPHLVLEWNQDAAANEFPGKTRALEQQHLLPTPEVPDYDFEYQRLAGKIPGPCLSVVPRPN